MKNSKQTTFIDSSEFGVITPEVIAHELGKLKALNTTNRNIIKSSICKNHGLEKYQFSQIIDNPKMIGMKEYEDIKAVIQHYKDIEALEKR